MNNRSQPGGPDSINQIQCLGGPHLPLDELLLFQALSDMPHTEDTEYLSSHFRANYPLRGFLCLDISKLIHIKTNYQSGVKFDLKNKVSITLKTQWMSTQARHKPNCFPLN